MTLAASDPRRAQGAAPGNTPANPPAIPPIPPLRTHWLAVSAIVASGIVAAFQVGKVVITIPALRADLGLDLTDAGWIMAIFSLLGVACGIPVGSMVGRFGARRLLVAGLTAITVGSATAAASHGFPLLLAMRTLEGLGFVLITIAGPSMLRNVIAAKDRDLAFSMWSSYMPTGMAMVLAVGGFVEGWRGVWWATAGLAALAALFVLMVVPGGAAGGASAGVKVPLRDVLAGAVRTVRNAGSALLATCFATYTLQYFALFSFLPVLLIDRLGLTVTAAGAFTAFAAATNAIGTLVAGQLLSRGVIARWALILFSSAVMGVCAVAIFAADLSHAAVLVLCVVFSCVGGMLPSTVVASAPMLSPTPALVPVAIGMAMQGSYVGQVLGPLAVGVVVDRYGWSAAAVVPAVAAAIGMAGAYLLRPIFRRVN
ncbi:MFS transporter [Pigmentiphaga litoralis]|nr:MFS transporter [Pigmentiphaga litoralis]